MWVVVIMQLLISDANILIDMEVGGILAQMFALEYEFAVPDVLFQEELNHHHPHLVEMGLQLHELQAESIAYVMEIKQRPNNMRVSTNDLFALSLAKQKNCRLITGDRALRRLSEDEGVQVHGTIWIVDQMLNAELINCEQAEEAYRLMIESGSRLPQDDIEDQIGRYC